MLSTILIPVLGQSMENGSSELLDSRSTRVVVRVCVHLLRT